MLRSATMLLTSRILGLVLTLFQLKMATTFLGPHGYGLLSTALLLIGTFETVTDVGVGTIVVRRVAGGDDLHRSIGLAQAWSLLFMGPLAAAACLAALVLYRDQPQVVTASLVLAVGLLFTTWGTAFQPVAQLTDRFGGISLSDFLGRAVTFGIVLVAVRTEASLMSFVLAQLAAPVTRGVVLHLWGGRVGRFRPVWDFPAIRALVVESLPLTYIMILAGLYLQLDGLLLSRLTDPVQVGAYSLAFRTVSNVNVLSMALVAVLSARFAQAAAHSDAQFGRVLGLAARVIVALALPVAVLLGPFSPDIIALLGSTEFVPLSSQPLTLLWVAIAITMITNVISAAVVAGHAQKFLATLNTATLALNLVLNLLLIPRLGATGAAIALIATEGTGCAVALGMLLRRLPGFVPVRHVLVAVACAVVVLLAEPLAGGIPWVLRGLLVAAVYFAAVMALGVVRRSTFAELSTPIPPREVAGSGSPADGSEPTPGPHIEPAVGILPPEPHDTL